MKNRLTAVLRLGIPALMVAAAATAQLPFSVSGNITSGDQYDLYDIDIPADTLVTATLVCDFDGVSRPLDPVLSAYFPGSDSSDTINADYYNDDGFGLDDDPAGVDCDAFDSSRIQFLVVDAVTMTFRADGFGSSTGPYTLAISGQPGTLTIPVLNGAGVASFALILLVAGFFVMRMQRRRTN